MSQSSLSNRILIANTVAFAACFMVWTMCGVLVTFLVDNGALQITKAQIGWLIGAPILTGSVMRLPVGLLADRIGGKPVYIAVMLLSAVGLFLTSFADSFMGFLLGGLAFGLCGASFSVGVAYTAL